MFRPGTGNDPERYPGASTSTGSWWLPAHPLLHEATFRSATEKAGLNQFFMQMVNIRENDSWVHENHDLATLKAKDLVGQPSTVWLSTKHWKRKKCR